MTASEETSFFEADQFRASVDLGRFPSHEIFGGTSLDNSMEAFMRLSGDPSHGPATETGCNGIRFMQYGTRSIDMILRGATQATGTSHAQRQFSTSTFSLSLSEGSVDHVPSTAFSFGIEVDKRETSQDLAQLVLGGSNKHGGYDTPLFTSLTSIGSLPGTCHQQTSPESTMAVNKPLNSLFWKKLHYLRQPGTESAPRIPDGDHPATSNAPTKQDDQRSDKLEKDSGTSKKRKRASAEVVDTSTSKKPRTTMSKTGARKRSTRKKLPSIKEYRNVTDLDVLFGRGGRSNCHPGNQSYLQLIELSKLEYRRATKSDKTVIAQRVVDQVRDRGGYFLEKDDIGWFVADNRAARTKVGQGLRDENTPEKRAERRQKYNC